MSPQFVAISINHEHSNFRRVDFYRTIIPSSSRRHSTETGRATALRDRRGNSKENPRDEMRRMAKEEIRSHVPPLLNETFYFSCFIWNPKPPRLIIIHSSYWVRGRCTRRRIQMYATRGAPRARTYTSRGIMVVLKSSYSIDGRLTSLLLLQSIYTEKWSRGKSRSRKFWDTAFIFEILWSDIVFTLPSPPSFLALVVVVVV